MTGIRVFGTIFIVERCAHMRTVFFNMNATCGVSLEFIDMIIRCVYCGWHIFDVEYI